MDGYRSDTYGESIAEIYDDWHSRGDATATVETLRQLAGSGPALELAVGTGRLAIPLAAAGVLVDGIDSSPAMLDQLRAKPGGEKVGVVLGDMADVSVSRSYSLTFVVFNSFFLLDSQDDQVRCFANVAAHLDPGGCFVLECFVPELSMYDRGQRVSVTALELGRVRLDLARLSKTNQLVEAQHLVITPTGTTFLPVRIRYAWPAELDLMARLAGLRLRDRWGGWAGEPFAVAEGLVAGDDQGRAPVAGGDELEEQVAASPSKGM